MAGNILESAKGNGSISQTLKSYFRVLKLSRKPTREEFLMISKVAGAGILIIGFVGFVVYVLLTELPKWV
ncbi:protein transport protein SEC61 subunit gamma-like protein [Methanohalophilus levihalophilus]|nr:protein translocase SEC61 complex subunit gamma [Methanohalophilus levihalophilus]MBP2030039.1 protein transport protein SEC61 subunit gamma-like protein [Methanohalophilus levihalophilus]